MNNKSLVVISLLLLCHLLISGQEIKPLSNSHFKISWKKGNIQSIQYQISGSNEALDLALPVLEVEGKQISELESLKLNGNPVVLRNKVVQYKYTGSYKDNPSVGLHIYFQVSPDNPVVRFRYELSDTKGLKFTKISGKEYIRYGSFSAEKAVLKEVRLSEFNERFHASDLSEFTYEQRHFENEVAFMGPISVLNRQKSSFLLAYEHGSQYPDSFLQFELKKNDRVELNGVKGNYLNGQKVDGFQSVWFEIAGVKGSDTDLASHYRTFMLKYITENAESRKPYIFYNTWGRQERTYWAGQPYLSSMKLDYTLKEIDRAHEMGVEVYVIDMGWFEKAGDWAVNKKAFPDDMKQVKAKLEQYGMKMGLWFNPTVAAVSSKMYQNNLVNRMSWEGKYYTPGPLWETPVSANICLVSSYWENFADELIRLSKEIGVSYFKWDAVGQYGCSDPHHAHGNEQNTAEERSDSYAFLQPLYMSKIIDKVCKEKPESIFDFDITEGGRCMGLQFLSSGKFFIMNNGPYFHNYNIEAPTNNINMFVFPGAARGWITRSVLTYDKWIPSVLFLTHYQSDDPRSSQLINVASLILGQNGIWGDILKTSREGTEYVKMILDKYKVVRDDITSATMVSTGKTGGTPEIYEKIDPVTGKGCIVFFGEGHSELTYISKNKVVDEHWHTEDMIVTKDADGRAKIRYRFRGASARIVLFGTN